MLHPQHALAVYAESLAVDRRVAVLGDSSAGLGERMLDLGARSVLLWDPDEERAAHEAQRAPAGVVVRSLPLEDGDVRQGSVDLALVPDLGLFDDAQGVLSIVRQAVGDRGVAVVAAANRDVAAASASAFDYYELFDLVASEFDDVRMVAQMPFYGVALAELGREEEEAPSVSVDAQLADPGRAPEIFVAVASSMGASLEPYAIVELPAPPPLLDEAPDRDEVAARVAEAQLRAQALEGQLEATRTRLAEVEQASAEAARLETAQQRERVDHIAHLERALAERAAQLGEISVEVEEMRSAAEAGRVAATQVEEMARRADHAERALVALQSELSRIADAHAAEHARFEEVLRDRAQAIRLLEAELLRRDRMVRELVDALEESAGRPPPAFDEPGVGTTKPPAAAESTRIEEGTAARPADDALAQENLQLRERLDALALELARREGEAQASAWSVSELERQLAQASERASVPSAMPSSAARVASDEVSRQLAAALDELDVLRQAVAQEHAQRVRAESGEELARARAEIDRQAALLEKLGHREQSEGGLHPPGK